MRLDARRLRILEDAASLSGGDPAWRLRKSREARDLLALSQIAPPGKFDILWLDLRDALRALLRLQIPVACRSAGDSDVRIVKGVTLGLQYPRIASVRPVPGWLFFEALSPRNIWMANVREGSQQLCLGASIAAGTRAFFLVVMASSALTLQSVQVDEQDPAGIFNVHAAKWWQRNLHRTPLTRAAFLDPEAPALTAESNRR